MTHVSRFCATACGMPPASRFMMDTARHLASSCGLLNKLSRCGTSTVLGLSGAPGTSLSSCTGVSSAICAQGARSGLRMDTRQRHRIEQASFAL